MLTEIQFTNNSISRLKKRIFGILKQNLVYNDLSLNTILTVNKNIYGSNGKIDLDLICLWDSSVVAAFRLLIYLIIRFKQSTMSVS
jgi:hypothetical protein